MFNSISRPAEHHDQYEQLHPSIEKTNEHSPHHTHSHVMTYTHRFNGVVQRQKFEKLFSKIPTEVYRAKGVVKFEQDHEYYLFQYAFREIEIVKIKPQQSLKEVAVFIGEHFDKNRLKSSLQELTII
jgi:G3E family GTPase